ncbi:proline racemase family protein [Salinicoccus roseus]|uniref:proline racemase family protein n=1 Tax=Salinicoccus roseus TaxID=45670 RepID=UPI000F5022AE|nr:proline racemase family protein [Salinicoccus roseus]RPE54694.1 proline racemase [Salinicoccus roseus]GGA63423.1 proline racemase [Salinicoccus roseus]
MINSRQFITIDTHTGGNPTRTVMAGMPPLKGATIQEKMADMKTNHDHIRKFLVNPPRGHDVMSGTILLPPLDPKADFSAIFIETGGYLPMCGHDTIGTCTALVELGYVTRQEPVTKVVLDTPAGIVEAECRVSEGKVESVSFISTDSFHLKTVHVDHGGVENIRCDIAYGGNFYGIIKASDIGLELEVDQSEEIVMKAMEIRDIINDAHEVRHPSYPFIDKLTHMELYEDGDPIKNTVIVPPGGIDRSPCGTGTCAKAATLHHLGMMEVGEDFIHESITGSQFTAKILSEDSSGKAVHLRVLITGSAWLMGRHDFYMNADDPLRQGYLLIPELPEVEV